MDPRTRTNHRRRGRSSPRAPGEDLRSAYLDLLKRSLCDLLWPVVETRGGASGIGTRDRAAHRRLEGNDWPLRGLTMVGLKRFDRTGFRSARCGSRIPSGACRSPDPESYPADGESDWRWHERSYLEVPADEVRANFERYGLLDDRVRFLEGWFADTLPTVRDRTWALIRLDGDMYESTWIGLESLYPGLSPGGYVIIDDYHDVVECRRAVDDFRRAHGIVDHLTDVDGHCVRWRRSR